MKTIMLISGALIGLVASSSSYAGVSGPHSSDLSTQSFSIAASASAQQTTGQLMLADNTQDDKDKAARKAEKEKKQAERKAAQDKKMAEQKAANDKKMAERKAAHDKRKAERMAAPDQGAVEKPAEGKRRFFDRRKKALAERNGVAQKAAPGTAPAAVAPVVAAPAAAPKPAAQAAAPSAPLVVKSYPASSVWYAGATLNGYTTFPGKTGRAWFEWGNSPSFGQATAAVAFTGEKSIGTPMRVPARGKYYYRLVAESSGYLVNGETLTFEAK